MKKWIKTADKLPENDEPVLAFVPMMGNIPLFVIAWYDPEFGFSGLPSVLIDAITHWMPLPSPPEEFIIKQLGF